MTLAPLPAWGELFSGLLNPPLSNDALAASWCRTGEEAFWFSCSAWSLAVVALWWQRVVQRERVTVWIPDFFCNASLVPLRGTGAQIVFYPVTDQMVPDLDACRHLAREHSPDIVVLVHYFGRPVPGEPIAAFCKEQGAWLVEDAVHVLRPVPGVGEVGDCVLYSPHKHLSIPDGAVLVVRGDGPGGVVSQLSAMHATCRSVLDAPGFSHRSVARWLVKRVLQRLGLRSWHRSIPSFQSEADIACIWIKHPKMSRLARCLLSGLLDNIDSVALLRQQNERQWDQALMQSSQTLYSIGLVSGENTPYLAVVVFDDATHAELMFLRWQRAGLPVTTWPDLPPEVLVNQNHHPIALHLRKTRVYLPVHQTLNSSQFAVCVQSLLKLKEV